MICGNPYIEAVNKPQRKEDFWKLSTDPDEKKVVKKRKPRAYTEREVKIYEMLSFNK